MRVFVSEKIFVSRRQRKQPAVGPVETQQKALKQRTAVARAYDRPIPVVPGAVGCVGVVEGVLASGNSRTAVKGGGQDDGKAVITTWIQNGHVHSRETAQRKAAKGRERGSRCVLT